MTEVFRISIEAVPYGETEAARACGMSEFMVLRKIMFPNAMWRALPVYSNEVNFVLHGSVVGSTITIIDALGAGRKFNHEYYLAFEGLSTSA
jgi:ABC-type arginine/histidine transport system permease subunit